jgi:hypothetical protein
MRWRSHRTAGQSTREGEVAGVEAAQAEILEIHLAADDPIAPLIIVTGLRAGGAVSV